MSNNAMRILYTGLNALAGIRCERVFAPARDFEKLLRETRTPLYTLESGIPLCKVDMLAFTIGYELSATNILTVLDLGGIPLETRSRSEVDPIVIAGGPAITNPLPLSRFLDAVWIGEAEAGFFQVAAELADTASRWRNRSTLIGRLQEESAVWMPGKSAVRSVDMDFQDREYSGTYPWPSIKPVQDHGTVEIMRGCPNGCRFCHAGYFYRPQRVRSPEKIFREIESLVLESGYREITLSSLSSGDYPGLVELVRELNRRWGGEKISFQLPSLRVESFDLPILEELTHTRKSGLTFAVETPEEAWQRSINKSVSLDKILSILEQAAHQGYRLAKFYFMIGLPIPGITGAEEADAMINFLRCLLRETGFHFNVNIGTFIPKPHTPFQWCPQIREDEAFFRLRRIKESFRTERKIKISYHTPFVSMLEGILSRGDERVGELIFSAWLNGARLDAWEDLMDKNAWRYALESAPTSTVCEALDGRPVNSPLPWDEVSLRIGRRYLQNEWQKTVASVFTPACKDKCANPCGTCGDSGITVLNNTHPIIMKDKHAYSKGGSFIPSSRNPSKYRLVLQYQKTGASAFLPHHSVLSLFTRALQLTGIPLVFSQGYNPAPRIEIEDPIPLGMYSLEDYLTVMVASSVEEDRIRESLNQQLPNDLPVLRCAAYRISDGIKNLSLSSMTWGSDYCIEGASSDYLPILESALKDPRLSGSMVLPSDPTSPDSIRVRLRYGRDRKLGFGTIFEKTFSEPFSKSPIRVTRLRPWADVGSGPVFFFQAFDSLYGDSK